MKVNIHGLFKMIKKPPVTWLVFPSLVFLLSFRPVGGNDAPDIPVIRKEVKVETPFQGIRIDGDISVMLTNGPAGSVIIEGKEKDVNKIRPVIKNDVLVIDASRKNIFSKITLYLSATTLQTLELNGDANVTSVEFIKSPLLHLILNGNIGVRVKTFGKVSVDTSEDFELLWKSQPGVNKK